MRPLYGAVCPILLQIVHIQPQQLQKKFTTQLNPLVIKWSRPSVVPGFKHVSSVEKNIFAIYTMYTVCIDIHIYIEREGYVYYMYNI